MKAPLQPGKSFGSAASSAPVQRKGLKSIVDNRPTMVTQRKLQGVVQRKGDKIATTQHYIGALINTSSKQFNQVVQRFPGVISSAFQNDLTHGLREADGSYLKSDSIVDPSTLAHKDFNGILQYVITEGGELILGQRSRANRWAHPNLIGGIDPKVSAAGEIKFANSIPFAINNKSGHFQPPASSLELAKEMIGSIFNSTDKLIVGDEKLDLNIIKNPEPKDKPLFNIFGTWMPSQELIRKLITGSDANAPQLDEEELLRMFADKSHRLFNSCAHQDMLDKVNK